MRQYLALLKDSFREALASRVLAFTLAGIVLILALLAPFGLSRNISTTLRITEVSYPERLYGHLANALRTKKGASEDSDNEAATKQTVTEKAAAHLVTFMSEEQKKPFLQTDPNQSSRSAGRRQMSALLNHLMRKEGFYDESAFADVRASEELQELLDKGDLSETEAARRNVLLTAAAFPRSIRLVDSTAYSIYYGTAEMFGPLPIPPSQFEELFDQIVVWVTGLFLGFFGVFGCVLVSASLIPRTFAQGEIALLLSKPVSRAGLFLMKFFGGCIFTLLYSTVLVSGFVLLLGFRMGIWRPQLMYCIVVYLFLFMIYYSICAVAGAIWKNSMVAVVVTVVAALGLGILNFTHDTQQDMIRRAAIRQLVPIGDTVLMTDGEHNTWIQPEGAGFWKQTFSSPSNRRSRTTGIAPVYDSANERVLALRQTAARFGGGEASELVSVSREDAWEPTSLARVPEWCPSVFLTSQNRVVLPGRTGIYEYVGQSDDDRRASQFFNNLSGGLFGGSRNAFQSIHSDDLPELDVGFSVAMNTNDDSLVTFSRGQLTRLVLSEDGKYQVSGTWNTDEERVGVVSSGGATTIVGLDDGRLLAFDSESLEFVAEYQLPEGVMARTAHASSQGLHLIVTHEDTVIQFRQADNSFDEWSNSRMRRCTAIQFAKDGSFYAASDRRVIRHFAASGEVSDQEWGDSSSLLYQLYDYAIHPVYTVVPKTSELDAFANYILTGEKTIYLDQDQPFWTRIFNPDMKQARRVFEPVKTIRDNLIFVAVLLSIGCFYIARSDY